MRYANPLTPLHLPCYALTEAWKPSCGDHSVCIVGRVYITKIRFGAGGKILSRSVLRRGQRVRAGSTCYICVLLVHLCVIKGQRYIFFCCTTKPARSSWIYIVSKKFYHCVIFILLLVNCCFAGIVLHLLALLKASMGVVHVQQSSSFFIYYRPKHTNARLFVFGATATSGLLIDEVSKSHTTTSTVGLPWTSDKLVEETSTWQHTQNTHDKRPWPWWYSNPQSQQSSGRRPTP
jgi:hypothetical protein